MHRQPGVQVIVSLDLQANGAGKPDPAGSTHALGSVHESAAAHAPTSASTTTATASDDERCILSSGPLRG